MPSQRTFPHRIKDGRLVKHLGKSAKIVSWNGNIKNDRLYNVQYEDGSIKQVVESHLTLVRLVDKFILGDN